jgi:hypothetical protein
VIGHRGADDAGADDHEVPAIHPHLGVVVDAVDVFFRIITWQTTHRGSVVLRRRTGYSVLCERRPVPDQTVNVPSIAGERVFRRPCDQPDLGSKGAITLPDRDDIPPTSITRR